MLPAGIVGVDRITMSIVDTWGRTVWRTSVKPDGKTRDVVWNGRTATGRAASAGMYVVRIAVTGNGETTSYTRKAVTLKSR
jgi:hypothetical protein